MNRTKRLLFSMLTLLCCSTGAWAQSASDVLSGVFTINASGVKVQFSKGNLQYDNGNWQFAAHQFDYFKNDQSEEHCDLFAYLSVTFPDDGISWRIMSKDEWEYLLTKRSVNNTLSTGARYSKATIDGTYKGVIVFPDNYTHPVGTGFSGDCNNATQDYSSTVSLGGWEKMETAGCIFLPAAGYASGNGYSNPNYDNACIYKSSTQYESNSLATPGFYSNKIALGDYSYAGTKVPVRLVQVWIDPNVANLQQDAEGYYLIGSVDDWKGFAAIVYNEINTAVKARMTADIDLGDDQTMIGTESVPYKGTFDGQGHTLTVNWTTTGDYCAPFPYINGATFKNLHVTGTINTSHRFTGGLIGKSLGTSYVNNCRSSVEMISSYSGDAIRGGFAASVEGGTLNFNDCIFDGTFTGPSSQTWGGFVGWKNSYTVNIVNGLFVPKSVNVSATYSATFSGNGGKVNNSYYTVRINNSNQGTLVTAEQLANGTITTALQANRSEEVWVQDPLTNQPMLKTFATAAYTVPSSGIGTFSAKAKFAVPDGLTAYYCKTYNSANGTIGVLKIDGAVPANTGVVLRGTAGETYTLTGTNSVAATITDNALVAVTEATHVEPVSGDPEYTNFMMSGGKFVKIAASESTVKMPAYRAYLQILTSKLPPDSDDPSQARSVVLDWDDDATGIQAVRDSRPAVDGYYNLAGQRVAHPTKGLYIVGGRKVVIK